MSLYRQYEDPRKLQDKITKAKAELEAAKQRGVPAEDLVDQSIEIESLAERVNFAWQDEEFDCLHESYFY